MNYQNIKNGTFILGDCLEEMKAIPDGVIDMILCDLPYGTTQCKWDSVIPFDKLWLEYERIIKDNGAIVLTASMPFTAALVMSNIKNYRYNFVWDKVNRYTGFLDVNKKPLKRHEDICVFYKNQPTYNKQMVEGKPYHAKRSGKGAEVYQKYNIQDGKNEGTRNPISILSIKADVKSEMGLHPTQKPISLFEYLIKTYTNEGDLVLDNCAGSGTTAIAAENTKRRWVCIEQDEIYANKAAERILTHEAPLIANDIPLPE